MLGLLLLVLVLVLLPRLLPLLLLLLYSSYTKANLGQFVEIGQGQAFQREQMQWARGAPSLLCSVRRRFVFPDPSSTLKP